MRLQEEDLREENVALAAEEEEARVYKGYNGGETASFHPGIAWYINKFTPTLFHWIGLRIFQLQIISTGYVIYILYLTTFSLPHPEKCPLTLTLILHKT